MLSEKTFNKIVWEYQNGGVVSNHPELTTYERKVLLRYLISLPTVTKVTEQGRAYSLIMSVRRDSLTLMNNLTKEGKMNLDEYTAHVEATRKASLAQAIALMSEANAKMSEMFNLDEENN